MKLWKLTPPDPPETGLQVGRITFPPKPEPCRPIGGRYIPPPLKLRPGDQQLPVVNDEPDIQSRVIADIEARREVGISRYGTALQPFNGRDALRDAYEEAIDLAMYLKQEIVERDLETEAYS